MRHEVKMDFSLSLLDIAVLLYHLHRGAQLPDLVGYESADQTLRNLTFNLDKRRIMVDRVALESALWSANLMDENALFWSPRDENFNEFVKKLLSKYQGSESLKFDRKYNQILIQNEPIKKES